MNLILCNFLETAGFFIKVVCIAEELNLLGFSQRLLQIRPFWCFQIKPLSPKQKRVSESPEIYLFCFWFLKLNFLVQSLVLFFLRNYNIEYEHHWSKWRYQSLCPFWNIRLTVIFLEIRNTQTIYTRRKAMRFQEKFYNGFKDAFLLISFDTFKLLLLHNEAIFFKPNQFTIKIFLTISLICWVQFQFGNPITLSIKVII